MVVEPVPVAVPPVVVVPLSRSSASASRSRAARCASWTAALTAGPTWVPAARASALARWAAAETACPMFLGDWVVVEVVLRVALRFGLTDGAPELAALPGVVLPDLPPVFSWASWTAELTAWPRLLNPASWAAAFAAWAVEVAASETALPTPRPA